jgi:hypothetical protein
VSPEAQDSLVTCSNHGRRPPAIVCTHIIKHATPVGFIENSSDPDDLQAWCHLCEAKFDDEGGSMTDAFLEFNDMAVVCIDCYGTLKVFHSRAVV